MAITVLFIQLPVQDPDGASAAANVPLAAGYLAACAERRFGGRFRFSILPREVVDYGGDEGILRSIGREKPGIAVFTLYLWNRERSLFLARRLKRRIPGLVIFAGGPEAADAGDGGAAGGLPERDAEAGALDSAGGFPGIDAVAAGEGEGVFLRMLEDHLAGRLRPLYAAGTPVPPADIPNPYLSGHLPVTPGGPVYLETMRGCPNRCSYCYYGKACGSVRRFPDPVVDGVFAAAAAGGAAEIYIMDPSFNAAADMEGRLRRIAGLNRLRLPLHTELRLESMTRDRARLLREAGFRSVEAGLQSIHPGVLRKVRRSFDREKFLRGAGFLRDEGIEIRTGVILGLPGDTRDGFRQTLDFVAESGLGPGAEIYPLAILPGTELRSRAAEFGLDHMPRPPYWTLRTPAFPEEDMIAAVADAEDILGIEYFRPVPPRFSSLPGWTGFADLGRPGAAEALAEGPEKIASDLTLLVPGRLLSNAAGVRGLEELGENLLRSCPFTFYKLVVDSDPPLGEKAARAAESVAEAFFNPAHPVNRTGAFHADPQGRFSVRLFRMTGAAETARRIPDEGGGALRADLILRCAPGSTSDPEFRRLLRKRPFAAFDEKALGKDEIRILRRLYREHPALLLRLNDPAVPG